MKTIDLLKKRRSYYVIGDDIADKKQEIIDAVKGVTDLTPHPFNVRSTRVILVLGQKNKELWDAIYDAFGGQVEREKIDSFKAGYGTVLYFCDNSQVKGLQEQFPAYADRFPIWAEQSLGMTELGVWNALRELEIGASIQHYNPIIDEKVSKMFDIPSSWILNAQMPFGNILQEPEEKDKGDINQRFKVVE